MLVLLDYPTHLLYPGVGWFPHPGLRHREKVRPQERNERSASIVACFFSYVACFFSCVACFFSCVACLFLVVYCNVAVCLLFIAMLLAVFSVQYSQLSLNPL